MQLRRVTVAACCVAVASAIAVVHVRHENRVRFIELQEAQAERDRLNVQWGQLLLEQGTWGLHSQVEKTARERLGMSMPQPEEIVIVPLEEGDGQWAGLNRR
jgi:cell division protein FtsL